jgi:Mg/Co/Ni transporter MgtE
LRELSPREREHLLRRIPGATADHLRGLLAYRAGTAGGVMTTRLVTASATDTVATIRAALSAQAEHHGEIDAVAVLDAQGRLIADVPLFDLLISADDAPVGALLTLPGHDPAAVTVPVDATIAEVAARLVDSRSSSLLVLDATDRPVGRILADDLVDALLPERGRAHPGRYLP